MTTPQISSNVPISSSVSDLWQEAGQAFGHIWKTIHQLPHQFYQIILTIRDIIVRCLGFPSKQDFSAPTIPPSPAHIIVTPSKPSTEETEGIVSPDLETNDDASPVLGTKDNTSLDLAKEEREPLVLGTTRSQTSLILEDPLGAMCETLDPLNQAEDNIETVFQAKNTELDQEILKEARQVVQPAHDLLKNMRDKPPATLQASLDLRNRLEGTLVSLKSDVSIFTGIEEAHEIIQKAFKALQEEMNLLDDKLYSDARNLVQPAQDLLKRIGTQKRGNLQAYLDLREQFEDACVPLKRYASTFIAVKEAHRLVQRIIQELEQKVRILDKELCALVKRQYRPNPAIPTDGHCLFWSIRYLLKSKEGVKYYRKLAADFIRKHPEEFDDGVRDNLKSQPIQDKINDYVRAQGGKKKWMANLKRKLGKEPTTVDQYCDCLEHSKMWGGYIELLALSGLGSGNPQDEGAIQIPILVFTRQVDEDKGEGKDEVKDKDETWRIAIIRRGKFKDKPPLLLYYNGLNHYQNLIRR